MDTIHSFWRALVRDRRLRGLDTLQRTFDSLSIAEKALFVVLAGLFAFAALSLTAKASAEFSSNIPHRGGELVEGVVGTARFVNPLLAVSDADRDLTALIYSGLLKPASNGTYAPDLAESYTISDDGREFSFIIRENAVFHDGKPVTSDDIEFTVQKALDSVLKSPRRVSWEGVSVEKTGPRSIVFRLKQPYAPFVANLTLGILPKHLWSGLQSDQIPFSEKNIQAIGSGPYKIVAVERTDEGIPASFTLQSNRYYALGEPYIDSIRLRFYPNERALVNALQNGEVEGASNLSPSSAYSLKDEKRLLVAPLTRVFGIFFNPNENETLLQKDVRKALDLSIDKEEIIEGVLLGYGSRATGPLPPTVSDTATAYLMSSSTAGMDDARALLSKAKWKANPEGLLERKDKSGSTTLSLSLSTANVPELVEIARRIEGNWKDLGAEVDVRVFEPTDLNQGVIRPRNYEALLFGIVTNRNADLYPFWHSSQRNDPGLNVSLYTNVRADRALERMRVATSASAYASEYLKLTSEIDADVPAIFLWSPDFIYAVPQRLRGIELSEITTPSDRFAGVEKWYVETDLVWNIFIKDRN